MNKSTIIVLAAALISTSLRAQSLSASVVATSGDHFQQSVGALSWTLGELITETFSQDRKYLTQGFHQPAFIRVTGLENSFEVTPLFYPNPVRDFLHIEINDAGNHHIELFNLQGQRLFNMETANQAGLVFQIDMQPFANALYLVRVTKKSIQESILVRIEKY